MRQLAGPAILSCVLCGRSILADRSIARLLIGSLAQRASRLAVSLVASRSILQSLAVLASIASRPSLIEYIG
jgi:hypothetical protein